MQLFTGRQADSVEGFISMACCPLVIIPFFIIVLVKRAATVQIEWTQSAPLDGGMYNRAAPMPPIELVPMDAPPQDEGVLRIDRSVKYQSLNGFGGAFTEASALNWRSLPAAQQAEVIKAYFASADDGGLGYTLGRVPMGSCDFGPGDYLRSYSFANVSGDVDLKHFDNSVSQDVQNGIIPMILAAQKAIASGGGGNLTLFASPWSPPGWMKLPVEGVRSMLRTAKPNGLDPQYQRAYATYFSRFISGYAAHGISMWGVTVQNEAEAADVGWEKCVYTPEFMARFVKNHLRPVLDKDHPGTKIIGFDHNKDHVLLWAKGLYADPEARAAFDGIGVHWYGGLNTANLDSTHETAPDKFILATEACNCPGVIYEKDAAEWWQRAEHLGMDILQDLLHWCTGWVDWNLILDITGGPNHLGNRCDANLIADPPNKLGYGKLVYQASYYFMGHFSKYLPAGSRRIESSNRVVKEKVLTAADVTNGSPLVFLPCSGSELQSWSLDGTGSLLLEQTKDIGPKCVDISSYGKGPRLDAYACAHSQNQLWVRREIPECSEQDAVTYGKACSQLVASESGMCLTKVAASGAVIGLDAGTMYTVAQALACEEAGHPSQTFDLVQGDQGGFPNGFPVRSPPVLGGDNVDSNLEACLQPFVAKEPTFGAVAFERPDGYVAVVAQNRGEEPLTFTLYDDALELGATGLTVPPHSIQSYKLPATVTVVAKTTLASEPTAESHVNIQHLAAAPAAKAGPDPANEAAHTWPLPMSLALSALALAAVTAAGLLHVHTHAMAVRSEENNREDSDTPYEPLGDRGAP